MLDSIFGGSTSSRLFREVREKRGLAYSVGSYNEQYTDSGLVATYVGTREDNVEEACAIIGAELERLRTEPVSGEELARAKENVKGRLVLSSESTAARMTRISRATLFDLPIDSLDEMLAKVDAVEVDDLTALAAELYGAERLSAACVGRGEDCFREALAPVSEALVGRHDPGRRLRSRRADGPGRLRGGRGRRGHGAGREGRSRARGRARRRARRAPTSSSTSPRPRPRSATSRACLEAGVHVVVGTTGFEVEELREAVEAAPGERQLLRRPQLRDRRGAADGGAQLIARHMPECEIVELHHDKKLDAPSGTAKRTAELIREAGGNVHEPIHSVRLPGPRRPPGGHLRRRGPDAQHPPRLDRPALLHAGGPARRAQGRRAARAVHRRAREVALGWVR